MKRGIEKRKSLGDDEDASAGTFSTSSHPLSRARSCSLFVFSSTNQTSHSQFRGPGVSDSNDFIHVLDDAITATTGWISSKEEREGIGAVSLFSSSSSRLLMMNETKKLQKKTQSTTFPPSRSSSSAPAPTSEITASATC